MQFAPHWHIGGVFIIGVLSFVVGLVLMAISIPIFRPFFRGEVMSPEPELAEPAEERLKGAGGSARAGGSRRTTGGLSGQQ